MRKVNMREAKTHLSRLVRDAENGVPFIIARAGKPVVKVISVDVPVPDTDMAHRVGFLDGQITVPDDFDHKGSTEIKKPFEGGG